MNEAYLLTGGNIGDRFANLNKAGKLIQKYTGAIVKKSDVYETAAWGLIEQPAFLNQVLLISTFLKAEELLNTLLSAELELGRERLEKMGPRTIDIDILFYNTEIISSPGLVVPHPRIAQRRFVLIPLNEIAPDFVHPVLQKSIGELLSICPDELEVKKYADSRKT